MKRFSAVATALLATLAATGARAQAPWWSGDTVCYQVFVRSFQDSDGDGIGDLNGLTRRLDYINDGNPATKTDLGASCVWLMPIAESPSYHGYDVVDQYRVERDYGTADDFRRLMAEAHRRGVRVIVDLVLNHLSSDHPYFKQALVDPASPYRKWFLFSPTAPEVRGPWDQQVWHRSPYRDEHYFGVFVSGMPDLDYSNPAVREEARRVARYWVEEMGVDGFRLDAVAHLVEDGAQMKHVAGSHEVLREWAAYVHRSFPGAFTVGEVWDATAPMLAYYPDQLHTYFAFEPADAMLEAVKSGRVGRLHEAVRALDGAVPAHRWSPFLRNHDMPRTLTELGGDVAKARAAATMQLTLPGVPFVYYGEEIGMTGGKPDPRIRTPMHWTRAPKAGFTTGDAWEPLQPDSLTANVEAQTGDPNSLLSHYRALIQARAAHPALGGGDYVPLETGSDAVAAYLRTAGDRAALVVVNVSGAPVEGVRLSSAGRVLPAGRYTAAPLVGGRAGARLSVGADGAVRGWVALPRLGALESQVLDLAPAR